MTDRGREHTRRPESPGWTDAQTAEYDRLFEEPRKATAAVNGHGWWGRCAEEGVRGGALVDARTALKHADGAVLLGAGDVSA